VVTGKPISIGGSLGRAEATGTGPWFIVVEEACKLKKIPVRGASVAVQGFGNAGATAARLLFEEKSENRRIKRHPWRCHKSARIDPIKALRYKGAFPEQWSGCPVRRAFRMTICFTMKCDILVPAALENVITLNNAEAVKARIVAEAANGPTLRTPTKFWRGAGDCAAGTNPLRMPVA